MAGRVGNKNNIIPLKKNEMQRGNMDFLLLFTILILFALGLMIVISATSAANMMSSKMFMPIIKQVALGGAGLVMMFVIASMDYRRFRSISGLFYIIIQILMFVVPVIGFASHGATRQIDLKLFSFQPSEFSKYCMIMLLAARFAARRKEKIDNWNEFWSCMAVIVIPVAGCFVQRHASAALLHMMLGVVMLISSGVNFKKLGIKKIIILVLLVICAGALVFVKTGDYRVDRIKNSFSKLMGQETDTQGIDWQSIQSEYAVGSGGLFGLGIGNSRQKYSYLPEAENDYIFAIVGEEIGFFGSLGVILLYCLLIWRGVMIAINCKDKFGSYLAFGISVLTGLQVLINMSVVLQLIPPTGMQLPLFSLGGTSLMVTLMGFGILLSISRYTKLSDL